MAENISLEKLLKEVRASAEKGQKSLNEVQGDQKKTVVAEVVRAGSKPLDEIGRLLHHSTPAVVREVVERAKLAAVSEMKAGDQMRLTENALRISAETMKMHRDLMDQTKKESLDGMEVLGNVIGIYLKDAVQSALYGREGSVRAVSTLPGVVREKDLVGDSLSKG